jgi:hypothetical protein
MCCMAPVLMEEEASSEMNRLFGPDVEGVRPENLAGRLAGPGANLGRDSTHTRNGRMIENRIT